MRQPSVVDEDISFHLYPGSVSNLLPLLSAAGGIRTHSVSDNVVDFKSTASLPVAPQPLFLI